MCFDKFVYKSYINYFKLQKIKISLKKAEYFLTYGSKTTT